MAKFHTSEPDLSHFAQEAAQLEELVKEICEKIGTNHTDGLRALKECICQGYVFLFPILRRCAEEERKEVRQALVQAVGEAADPGDPFRASFLLEILSPLLHDPSPEIRRAARRVLRGKLLAAYPEETVEVLVQWAADPEPKRKVLAARLLGYTPPKFSRRALIALKHLAHAEDKTVRRAVVAALKRLVKEAPQLWELELSRWKDDPVLSFVAKEVLDGQDLAQNEVQKERGRPSPKQRRP